MQFLIVNILIVPSKNYFMNEIGAFVTVYTQIPTSNLNANTIYLCTVEYESARFTSVYIIVLAFVKAMVYLPVCKVFYIFKTSAEEQSEVSNVCHWCALFGLFFTNYVFYFTKITRRVYARRVVANTKCP